ncbi:MAG: C69 family dipeptidase [Aeriscardovia sp.]|nr:C69 family dipeptidase [Aeriscardovia sp.]MBO5633319.1 C69 family dipeptidase [Aeriscardovia sp.]
MACTTLLVGKNASYDGSTIMARNEDTPNGMFNVKKLVVVQPEDQPRHYRSVCSHVEMDLPGNPLRYTNIPDSTRGDGIWGEAGINEANVAMTATETITTNERVLGADPYIEFQKAVGKEGDDNYQPEIAGGIGEEDLVTIVLPYIKSAREGVIRLGSLLEKYGTYEPNAIGFADADEIWWLETIGGHHWMAKRVPDDCYVTMPNQLGIDEFDLEDALGEQKEHMCSADLREFIEDNHLNVSVDGDSDRFNPRDFFGSRSDTDHVYNTPRAWFMQRYLNPYDEDWDSPDALHTPESDDIPWARQPERKVTIEDVKYCMNGHYNRTPYDPYGDKGTSESRRQYRPIGINRTSELSILQIRPYAPESFRSIQWVALGSNPFNTLVPVYTNVDTTPEYLAGADDRVTPDYHYWANRLIAALADGHYNESSTEINRYQEKTLSYGHANVRLTDAALAKTDYDLDDMNDKNIHKMLEEANQKECDMLKKDTDELLSSILYISSMHMKNGFFLSDN